MPLELWTASGVDDRASLKRFSVEAMWWATIFVASPVFILSKPTVQVSTIPLTTPCSACRSQSRGPENAHVHDEW
jgi:hypothetical protein